MTNSSEYYDELETRSADERQATLMDALPSQVANAKSGAPYFSELLNEFIAEEINTFCDTIDDPTDKCDAGNLGEKDVMNLLLMYQHSKNALQNQLTANDEDDTLL